MQSAACRLARRLSFGRAIIVVLGLSFSIAASATSITYDVSNLSGNTWQYDFTITNDSPGVPIPEFTLFFDFATFSDLTAVSEPAEYVGPAVIQPVLPTDPIFPVAQDGFFDYLATDAGLTPNSMLTGFTVNVDFAGVGTPGGPTFQTLDAAFNTLDSGTAAPNATVSVSEPGPLALISFGFVGLLLARRSARVI
jgi:hypothetical protein